MNLIVIPINEDFTQYLPFVDLICYKYHVSTTSYALISIKNVKFGNCKMYQL